MWFGFYPSKDLLHDITGLFGVSSELDCIKILHSSFDVLYKWNLSLQDCIATLNKIK